MAKESEVTISVFWPEGTEPRAEELYNLIADEVEKALCGDPHPETCPVDWTMSGTLERESGDFRYLKRHSRVDLEWLHDEFPDDERITQALELMKEVDDEQTRNNGYA